MTDSSEKPLITFALLAYNQERYIREAVEGALSQTYSPLEIILSDDCSSDATFKIMQQMAEDYSGPHKIILNQNHSNIGLAGHINNILDLSNGEFFVVAAGDDVSFPNRTAALVSAWIESGKRKTCVYSDMNIIDNDGNIVKKAPCHKDFSHVNLTDFLNRPRPLACTYGFSIEMNSRYGKLNESLINEDYIFAARALALNERLIYVSKPLVDYRRSCSGHLSKLKGMNLRSALLISLDWELKMLDQINLDLQIVNPNWLNWKDIFNSLYAFTNYKINMLNSNLIQSILLTYYYYLKYNPPLKKLIKSFLVCRYPNLLKLKKLLPQR